ncbi:MAG: sulfite exporter TauE/SafE family protein [Ancalomicrobiaceae bacterium]|nr:sulfite exporter TauE/SafE family protein [Ancalomicrobiaceae bacterium]
MTPADIAFQAAAVVSAIMVGLSKGGLPAIGSLAVPILALVISPITAAGLLLPIFVVSDWFGLWVYRKEFSRRVLLILIPAGIVGVGIGWATASWMPEPLVTLIVGLIGVAYCLLRWFAAKPDVVAREAKVAPGIVWGTVTGFVSFVSHSGAPPFQMYVLPLNLPKMIFAGTSTITFAVINAVKLVPYWALGQFSTENLAEALVLVPVAVVATFAGAKLTRILPDKLFFQLVTVALFVISAKLMWDGTIGLWQLFA